MNNGVAALPYLETMEYFPTGNYLWRNPIWVNLLGDPTTRAFPLAPPARVTVEPTATADVLSWTASPDPDVLGYRVYRSSRPGLAFDLLSGEEALTETQFASDPASADALYMVRAYGLKTVAAGSFHTLSQGAFATAAAPLLPPEEMRLVTPRDTPLTLPASFDAPRDGIVRAFLAGPEAGELTHDDTGWTYVPPPGFAGDVALRYSLWDGQRTEVGALTIAVGGR